MLYARSSREAVASHFFIGLIVVGVSFIVIPYAFFCLGKWICKGMFSF